MCVLLLFALTLFVAVQLRRRSALGFAALMNGLAFETTTGSFILGLPFIFFGGWLLIRAWRVQQYGSPTATKATAGGAPAPRPARPVRQPRERKKKTETTTSGPGPGPRPPSATRPRRRRGSARHRRRSDAYPAPRRARGSTGVRGLRDHEGRAQQGQDVGPPADERAGGRLLAEPLQHRHLRDHPDHGRIDRQQQQPRLVPAHRAGVHLRLEEVRGALHERIEGLQHLGGGRRPEARHLAQQARAARAGARPAGTPSARRPRPGPSSGPAPSRASSSAWESSRALRSMTASSTASLLGNQ